MIKEKNNRQVFFSKGTKFQGKIESKYNIYLSGEVKGEVVSEQDIYVLRGAKVFSSLKAVNIQILGLCEGDVTAAQDVIISEDARVFGNIICKSLDCAQGAIYSGELQVTVQK
ncbi:MAG: polymer-forming cytoskeletal protein [Candidatus Margulisbacteria bacterium]|nr:polymer-forming cytoskeletal protein [Candidatus Margulisiibacteriota bacterium]